MLIVVAIVYFISPIDLIPDFIPIVGLLDDIVVLMVTAWVVGSIVALVVRYQRALRHIEEHGGDTAAGGGRQQREDEQLRERDSAAASSSRGGDGEETEEPLFKVTDDEDCVICFGEYGARDSILMVCGHMLCNFDAHELLKAGMVCPFCRGSIQSIKRS